MSAEFAAEQPALAPHFGQAAKAPAAAKPGAASVVVCIRMSRAQRDRLRREAKGQNLSAYARSRLFANSGGDGRYIPGKDVIGRVLGMLGQSALAASMAVLAKAARAGTLETGPELADKLELACADIAAMRRDLIGALGIKAG